MNEIDFIVTWVDGNDENWLKEKAKYQGNEDIRKAGDARYRDWNLLKYWFRGIEINAPWVRTIFFVTNGTIPKWLNKDHPKLKLVDHKDFMDSKYLPTFNSRPIELNMHRIEGLSETFVYFNDDTYIINPVKPKDFFLNNLPKESAVFNPITPSVENISHIMVNDIQIINKYFNKNVQVRKNINKFYSFKYGTRMLRTLFLTPWPRFLGFYEDHLPNPYLKKTFEEVWQLESKELDKTCTYKFRDDSNLNQWVMRHWQLASGNFIPRSNKFGKAIEISDNNMGKITATMNSSRTKILCINDSHRIENFDDLQIKIEKLFEKKFPQKSNFEN